MKKQTKLNQKIKAIFNGLSFDQGVVRLSSDNLLELAMLLDISTSKADDAGLIKSLRRLWSEGDTLQRRIIVGFLEGLNQTFDQVLHEASEDKEEKIDTILKEFDISQADKALLKEHFMTQRLKKINSSKMSRFLSRHQLQHKKESLEKTGKGTFTDEGVFEFFHTFSLTLQEQTFTKIFVLHTKSMAGLVFSEMTLVELIHILEEAKSKEVAYYQELLDGLLGYLNSAEHKYLSFVDRIMWLKALSPESDLEEFSLNASLLQKIVKNALVLHNLIVTKSAMHALRKATYALSPTVSIHYVYELTVPLWSISAEIIKQQPLSIEKELEQLHQQQIKQFQSNYDVLHDEVQQECNTLNLPKETAQEYIALQLQAEFQSDRSLHISHKMHQKIIHNFFIYTADLRYKQQKEELLARTIRDFKALFPLARSIERTIVFHAGPTNSGKTHDAMQTLQKADTGVYLAPLRLLALEGYERLEANNVPTILLTGEEEIFNEDAGHVSSTIEMADFETQVDVAIIDEIQMISDRDRGWAWSNALIGIPAKTVVLTGSLDAVEAISELCEWLQEPLEIIYHERKNVQTLLDQVTPLKEVSEGTAVIAFSRNNVLRLRQQLSATHKVSVIYGNLSPEVRKEEARRFREGESDVLVATDAIAMGLNLPIKTLLFSTDNKYDGESQRLLHPTEVQQIAGRAGRYGLEEEGFIGAIDRKILKHVKAVIRKPLDALKPPFNVMASFSHIQLVSSILETENLSDILNFFAKHMKFDGPFKAANFESMQDNALVVDRYPLTLKDRFNFATAPVGSALSIVLAYESYVKSYAYSKKVKYQALENLPSFANTQEQLRDAEDKIKEISLYLWLAYRYSESFSHEKQARSNRKELNTFIEHSLQRGEFVKQCKICAKALPLHYEYAICQSCFMAQKRERRSNNPNNRYGSNRKRK